MRNTDAIIDVVMGGPGREAEVSRLSGNAVAAALGRLGYDVATIDCQGRLDPSRLRPDSLVINLIHGTYGEDGALQAELDALGRDYLGSTAEVSSLCMDKAATKRVLEKAGLPVCQGFEISNVIPPAALAMTTALVVKPACDGSSVGLEYVANGKELPAAIDRCKAASGALRVLVEERLMGAEYTVGVIADRQGGLKALPPIRIVPLEKAYDYHAKYVSDETKYEIITTDPLRMRLCELGYKAAQACQIRDLVRVDIMDNGQGELRILEVNTLPGFTSHSLLPKAAAEAGMDFDALVGHLVSLVEMRSRQRKETR